MGIQAGQLSEEEFERTTEEKARPVFQQLQQQASNNGVLQPKIVYGYFPVQSEGDDLIVYDPGAFEQGSLVPKLRPSELTAIQIPAPAGTTKTLH